MLPNRHHILYGPVGSEQVDQCSTQFPPFEQSAAQFRVALVCLGMNPQRH